MQHLIDKRKKFCSSMWAFRSAMGKIWGINTKLALWMYKAILLPKRRYASVVLWPMVSRVEARNLLRILQDNYLIFAVGSTKMTHTEVLEVALFQTPLDLAAIEAAGFNAYRLKCQGEWRNTGLGHTKLEFLHNYPFTLNQNRILKKYQLLKSFKIRIRTR
jgi:hypothetical protein